MARQEVLQKLKIRMNVMMQRTPKRCHFMRRSEGSGAVDWVLGSGWWWSEAVDIALTHVVLKVSR